MTENKAPLLQLTDIEKSFPGVRALDKVSFTLEAGSVHALMGENGAGKSTLMKCLFGAYRRDGGSILLNGEAVSFDGPRDALDAGVAMVHQELNQALKLSVAENMWLGRLPKKWAGLPFIDTIKMKERTREILSGLGLKIDPDRKVESLSVSERQMVEIARAVSYNARVIVFDEPTSSLSEKEVARLFGIIDSLKKNGAGIIYISHKMAEILEICDTVTVMRDGKHIATERKENLTTDKIISLMVGRELTERYPKRSVRMGGELLKINNLLGTHGAPHGVSLTLNTGEVLGIAGLDGAGKTELLETAFGLRQISGGTLTLDGVEFAPKTPSEAMRHGLALLTEERRKNGIFAILNIRENSTAASLGKYKTLGFINDSKRDTITRAGIKALKIKCPSIEAKISNLSGGNQQKVILLRLLETDPKVLLLDEPTRGVDVGAKYEIYTIINKLADGGKGVIIVSSEMAELIGICDRIAVMSGGKLAGVLNKDDATQEKIMELASKYL